MPNNAMQGIIKENGSLYYDKNCIKIFDGDIVCDVTNNKKYYVKQLFDKWYVFEIIDGDAATYTYQDFGEEINKEFGHYEIIDTIHRVKCTERYTEFRKIEDEMRKRKEEYQKAHSTSQDDANKANQANNTTINT